MSQLDEYRKLWSKYPDLDKKYYFDQLSLVQIKNILSLEESLCKNISSNERINNEEHSDEEQNEEENEEEDENKDEEEDGKKNGNKQEQDEDVEMDTQDKHFYPPTPYVVHGNGISYCESEINTQPIMQNVPAISFSQPISNPCQILQESMSNGQMMAALANCMIRTNHEMISQPKYYGVAQYEVLISSRWKPKKH